MVMSASVSCLSGAMLVFQTDRLSLKQVGKAIEQKVEKVVYLVNEVKRTFFEGLGTYAVDEEEVCEDVIAYGWNCAQ
jgi:hypothetical protein